MHILNWFKTIVLDALVSRQLFIRYNFQYKELLFFRRYHIFLLIVFYLTFYFKNNVLTRFFSCKDLIFADWDPIFIENIHTLKTFFKSRNEKLFQQIIKSIFLCLFLFFVLFWHLITFILYLIQLLSIYLYQKWAHNFLIAMWAPGLLTLRDITNIRHWIIILITFSFDMILFFKFLLAFFLKFDSGKFLVGLLSGDFVCEKFIV